MDYMAVFLIILLIATVLWSVVTDIMENKKKKEKFNELENTPIEVYRYTYKVYLNDGSSYVRVANAFCSVDFEEFVKRILLEEETLEIKDGLVIYTENITKAMIISKETKTIRPKVNKCYGGFYLSKGYSIEEVSEREV